MTTKKPTTGEAVISIPELRRAELTVPIIGTQPMIQNRMAAKAMQQLLVGSQKKTRAERVEIKHNPIEEYRNSAETVPNGPTALGLRVVAVKGAMATAALETPGLTKTSAQRLLFMPGELTALYGVPQLRMDVVRSADMNKTPDIRTRAFLPRWGAEVTIQHVLPQLTATSVLTLLANAGVLVGLGDGRQEKGRFGFGAFRVISQTQQDDEWDELVKNGGRMKQLAALENPEYANRDTEDLMAFYKSEVARRSAA